MLIVKDQKPIDTIYYISGCLLSEIDADMVYDMEPLYNVLTNKYNSNLSYHTFLLAIHFLYLLGKVDLANEKDGIKRVY